MFFTKGIFHKLFGFIALSVFMSYANSSPDTFTEAKVKMLAVYADHPNSFYCGCGFKTNGRKTKTILTTCKYTPRKPKDRRYLRLEWEHVMPASWLGQQRQCWKNGGRRNCRTTDRIFNKMESEMINLVPSVGEINRDRSNYRYGIIEREERLYGACDFEVDHKLRIAEPMPSIRGNVARIMLFMRDRYDISLSKSQTKLYETWHIEDPVDGWEKLRNKRIHAIQGYSNHYIPQ